MITIIIVLCFFAFTHFAMSIKKIYCAVYEDVELTKNSLIAFHCIAWGLLLVALYLCIELWQVEIGMTVWALVTQFSALLVAICLSYFPLQFASFWKRICIGGYLTKTKESI